MIFNKIENGGVYAVYAYTIRASANTLSLTIRIRLRQNLYRK